MDSTRPHTAESDLVYRCQRYKSHDALSRIDDAKITDTRSEPVELDRVIEVKCLCNEVWPRYLTPGHPRTAGPAPVDAESRTRNSGGPAQSPVFAPCSRALFAFALLRW